MALNALQLNNINQNLLLDRQIKSRFLSNPALTGVTGISPYLNGSTLGGVGLDTLAGMGVVGLGGSADAQIQEQLRKTDDLFSIGLSMSAPGSLAHSLTQKAAITSQQQSQGTLTQLMQQRQQILQAISTKQRLGLPISQQEQLGMLQIQQQLQKVLLEQQQFQVNFLGVGSGLNSLSGLGLGSGADLGTLGFGLQGAPALGGVNPFTTGVLGFGGLNSAAAPSLPLAQVFGGLGAGTGFAGIPVMQAPVQQPRYIMMMPQGFPMPGVQSAAGGQQQVFMLPPVVLRGR